MTAEPHPASDNEKVMRVLDRLEGVKSIASGWSALCPSHGDSNASLSVAEGRDGGVVIYCHAGCDVKNVMTALHMRMGDLASEPHIVESYPYTDEHGQTLYTIHRWAPKRFTCEPAGLVDAQRTLYRRDWIAYARSSGEPLYIVEGEKDANTLLRRGLPATCAPNGAGKWLPHYNELLVGCHAVVIADRDETGKAHARQVFRQIEPYAESARIATPAYGKDVADLYLAGFNIIDHTEPISENPGLTSYRSDQVVTKKVTWAWKRYIPFGAMTLFDGDPASGKSTFTMDLAARFSTGMAMPDGSDHDGPYSVVMISAEDDPEYTLVPRLRGAGARLDRVHLVTGGVREDISFNLGVDLPALEQMVLSTGARIITLDPLSAFLPSGMDSKMDTDVRNALQPIIHLAKRLGVALLVVRHLTKSQTKAMYAGGGSVGFIAASRAAFLIHNDPGQTDAYKIMAPIKTNLTRMPPAQSYSIESLPADEEVPYIAWHGAADWDAQMLMDGKQGKEERTARVDGQEYLLGLIDAAPPPGLTWEEVKKAARQDGYSEHTLRRSRGDLASEGTIRKVTNPLMAGGVPRLGTFWQRTTQGDGDEPKTRNPITSPLGKPQIHQRSVTDVPLPPFPGDPEPDDDSPELTDSDGKADLPTGQVRESRENGEKPLHLVTDEDRDEALMAKPKVCEVCGETDQVMPFAKPHWTVRCRAHNPFTWRR